jgi:hypothetical protein
LVRVLDETAQVVESIVIAIATTQVVDEVEQVAETVVDVLTAAGLVEIVNEIAEIEEDTVRARTMARIVDELERLYDEPLSTGTPAPLFGPQLPSIQELRAAMADATNLEAVNEILAATGNLRTTSLGSTRPDVILAAQILDQTDRHVQMRGWHWNTQYNQTFTPSASDEIEMTHDIFEVHESSGNDGPNTRYDPTARTDLAKRGTRLYNALDDTYTFTAPVLLNVVKRVNFEELPQTARAWITARAAAEFHEITLGKPSKRAEEKEIRTRSAAMAEDSRAADFNFFDGPNTRHTRYSR